MAYPGHKTFLPVVCATIMTLSAAYSGEEFMSLAPGMLMPELGSAKDKGEMQRKVAPADDEEKPALPVNVIKLTLPPVGHAERGIQIRQGNAISIIEAAPPTSKAANEAKNEIAALQPIYPPSPSRESVEAKPVVPVSVTPETVEALSPLDVLAEIPGCITPDVVAADRRRKTYYAATTFSAGRDDLLELVNTDMFLESAGPVGAVAISPELPAMPTYRDPSISTLEPFVPAPMARKPQPEQLRLPPPIVVEQPAAIIPPMPLPSVAPMAQGRRMPLTASVSGPLTATVPGAPSQRPMLLPPPDSAFPITGTPSRSTNAGASLLVAPIGMSLTASRPPLPPGYHTGNPATASGSGKKLTDTTPVMEYRRPLPRKKTAPKAAPSLSERNIPNVTGEGDDGFTTVRSIKNLLGQ